MRKIRSIHMATTAAIALSALSVAPAAHAGGWLDETMPLTGISGSDAPVAAITDAGTVVLAAALPDSGVAVVTRSPSGTFSTETLPTAHAADGVQVATDDLGDVAVSWGEYQASFVAERRAGGTFGTPQQVSDGGPVQLAVTDAGEVLAAWIAQEPQGGSLQERVRFGAAPFGAPLPVDGESLPSDTNYDGWALVAARHSGKAAVLWQRRGSNAGGVETPASIEAITREPGGSWSAPQLVSAPLGSNGIGAVAIDDAGAIAAAWSEYRPSNSVVQLARTGATGGPFGAPQQVSPAADDSTSPSLAMDAHGALALTWGVTRRPDMDHQEFLSAALRVGAPGDAPPIGAPDYGDVSAFRVAGPELLLSGASPSDLAADKSQAFGADSGHDVASVWARHDGSSAYNLHLRIWDATGPVLGPTTLPATVAAGTPVAFSITASDVLSGIASYRWTVVADAAPNAPFPLAGATTPPFRFPWAGAYTVTATVTDGAGNASSVARRITVTPAPVVVRPRAAPRTSLCRVPALRNHGVAYARRALTAAHCRLGRVTTPRHLRHARGLVIRRQSRAAGLRPVAGAHVDVTLGVRPRPVRHRRHRTTTKRQH